MTDAEFQEQLVQRLNNLLDSHPELPELVSRLIDERINVSDTSVIDHPTVQFLVVNDTVQDYFQLGFLGLLNGLLTAGGEVIHFETGKNRFYLGRYLDSNNSTRDTDNV